LSLWYAVFKYADTKKALRTIIYGQKPAD